MKLPAIDPARFVLVIAVVLTSCAPPDATRRDRLDEAFLRLVAAEDARPNEGRDLQLLIDGARDETVFLRRVAVRALGRLESPDVAHAIESRLADPAAAVRAEAANALAQAYFTSPGADAVGPLEQRVEVEADVAVRGALAHALGRLTLDEVDRRHVAGLLVEMSREHGEDAPREVISGVALGAEALIRNARGTGISQRLTDRLDQLTRYEGDYFLDPEGDRIRSLALLGLGQAGLIRWRHLQPAFRDENLHVGVIPVRYFGSVEEATRPEATRRAVGNRSQFTALEAFRYLQNQPRTESNCVYLFAGGQNRQPNQPFDLYTGVRVVALDALSQPCPDLPRQRTLLVDVVRTVDAGPGSWRPAVHALVSLATLFPDEARRALPEFAQHENPFVRVYGARAATILGDGIRLEALVRDPIHNVRTAALQGLYALRGHGAADIARAQMSQDDPQLVMTAARLLDGAPDRETTAEVALATFERMSAEYRETWRDVRMALLERIAAAASPSDSGRLIPYLADYDPAVAARAAEILEGWNGRPYSASPEPLPPLPLPSVEELRAMDAAHVVLIMREGGEIVIDLDPYVAPTNTHRFFRMVAEGWFDGLTFHRWAPNFVIQGGSPHANEYFGDGPFTRDEVGTIHWRGTVGISTRGHDTGDGQIFVNLMDNVRLDHTYTIIGTVVEGMDVVDEVFEGAVIERAELRLAN